jgi:VIT1/CCC1 family predicted Fe2+/Mn2+ transporter
MINADLDEVENKLAAQRLSFAEERELEAKRRELLGELLEAQKAERAASQRSVTHFFIAIGAFFAAIFGVVSVVPYTSQVEQWVVPGSVAIAVYKILEHIRN